MTKASHSGVMGLLLGFKQEHEASIERLSNMHDIQFEPYCKLLIERIQTQVLDVIDDGIESLLLLQSIEESALPQETQERLNAFIIAAKQLSGPSKMGVYE